MREICRAACQTSSSRSRDAIVQELFVAAPMTQMERMLFDIDELELVKSKSHLDCPIHQLRNYLTSIFHHRGHSYLDMPLLTPAFDSDSVKMEESTVKLIDSSGSKVLLPSSDRGQFINYCRVTKTVSERSYQQLTIYESRHMDKRHPRRRDIVRADIVALHTHFQLVELISAVGHLSSVIPEGVIEIHLNHSAISDQIISRFALRGDADFGRLRMQLLKHSRGQSFRYANKIQNLSNDRKFRRATRKYVSKDAEFVNMLNARPFKAARLQLRNLPKTNELTTAADMIDTMATALVEILPGLPVLVRPTLLNEDFPDGINFQIILRSNGKVKNLLNDDTKVIATGGEYTIPDTTVKRNIRGYGIDFNFQNLSDAKEIKFANPIMFQPVKVMIVSSTSGEKYSRISLLTSFERESIPTMIYDTKSAAIDLRDLREEFIHYALGRNVAIILHVLNSNKLNCYDQPFDRFLKKAHQVTKPETLTRHGGGERFTVHNESQDLNTKTSLVEYVRKLG